MVKQQQCESQGQKIQIEKSLVKQYYNPTAAAQIVKKRWAFDV